MWLEDFIPNESGEWWSNSAEVAEKMREAAKKAASWIKRVQKDEQKAKKYDDILAKLLVEIIKDKRYEFILEDLLKCLNKFYPSSFLIGVLSLINLDTANYIRQMTNRENIAFNYKNTEHTIDFLDSNIDTNIQKRINEWMEDIINILGYEYSNIQMNELIKNFNNTEYIQDKNNLEVFTSKVFTYFFKNLNIKISPSKSNSYTKFIINEVYKNIEDIDLEIDL